MKAIHPEKREYYLHRNAEMVGMCDRVIAFWDGVSRGTKFTIDYAKARNLDVKIFNPKEIFLDYFEAERVMNGECSPEDILAEREAEEMHCRED